MQRRAATDGAHHLHAASLAVGALHIDDFVALAHREIDGLLGDFVQLAHRGQGRVAHVQARFDQIAQLQKAQTEAITARFGAIHKAANGQIVQDAVRGGRMQAGFFADFFEGNRFFARRQHVQQRKHALDDLDGGGRRRYFFHAKSCVRNDLNFTV